MAIEDKLVNLKDLKVVKDKIDDDVANLKSAFEANKSEVVGIENRDEFLPLAFESAGTGIVKYLNGETTSSSGNGYTDYVDVSQCSSIKYKRTKGTSSNLNANSSGIAFYDSSKNYVFGIPILTAQASAGYVDELFEVPIPSGVKYARFTFKSDVATYGAFVLYGRKKIFDDVESVEKAVSDVTENEASTNLFDGYTDFGTIGTDGAVTYSASYKYTVNFIPVSEGDEIVLGYTDDTPEFIRYVTAYDSSKDVIAASGASVSAKKYTVPSGVAFVRISAAVDTWGQNNVRINKNGVVETYMPYGVSTKTKVTAEMLNATTAAAKAAIEEEVHSWNWIDPAAIAAHNQKYMDESGTVGTNTTMAYTDYIPVSPGQVVHVLQNGVIKPTVRYRFVTAFNASKEVVSASGESSAGRTYTVPEGIAFVIVTIFLANYNEGGLSINVGKAMPYDDYSVEMLPKGVGENKKAVKLIDEMPLSTLPDYIKNLMIYRPLPKPKKGYFCMTTDDGREGMVSYTIPMVIQKQIPCTFAVMSDSECFATEESTDTVVDAVQNHGCAIAQHGSRNWTEYSEYGLNEYFDEEKAFFASIGLTPKSACPPSSYMSAIVNAVSAGKFGIVRGGVIGYDEHGNDGGFVRNYYDYSTSGEGSNLYGLASFNFASQSLAFNKAAVDYAFENDKIMIVYIHENSLDDDKKAVIEATIDYAKAKGLEFITLDQIPYLNQGQRVL